VTPDNRYNGNYMKKWINIALFTTAVIAIVVVLLLRVKPKQQPVTTVQDVTRVIQNIPIIQTTGTPYNTEKTTFVFSFPDFPVPSVVKNYTVSEKDAAAVAQSFVKSFGISTDPIIQQGQPPSMIWSNTTTQITSQQNPPSVGYSLTSPSLSGNLPTLQEAANIVSFFTSSQGLMDPAYSLEQTSAEYFLAEGTHAEPKNSPQNADLISIHYQYRLNGNMIFNSNGGDTGITALIGRGGTILRSVFYLPPFLAGSSDKTPLPISTAKTALMEGRATLVQVSRPDKSLGDIHTLSVSEVNISEASLAYFWDTTQKTLSPVYVFSGSVTKGNKESVAARVTYLVHATQE